VNFLDGGSRIRPNIFLITIIVTSIPFYIKIQDLIPPTGSGSALIPKSFLSEETGAGHGFSDGMFVTYTTNGTPVGGLTNGTTYRVDVIDAKYIKLQGYA